MERKEFLKSLGASAAFAVAFPCLHACSSESGPEDDAPTGIDFTIDLSAPAAAPLQNNGGFILQNLVVVARNLEGNFVAASQVCSHQQTEEVRFVSDDGGSFFCSTHGSRFNQQGTPLNTVTNNPLKIYSTELNGDLLRVFDPV